MENVIHGIAEVNVHAIKTELDKEDTNMFLLIRYCKGIGLSAI